MAQNIRPVQGAGSKGVRPDGKLSAEFYSWLKRAEKVLNRVANVFGSPTGGNLGDNTINAEEVYEDGERVLTEAGGRTLRGGFVEEEFDLGTPANGATVTPNPLDGLKQKITNNVAGFTIVATTQIGDCEVRVTNGASAGTITFSGFVQWSSDPLTTTNGHQFVIFIFAFGGDKRAYLIKKLQ